MENRSESFTSITTKQTHEIAKVLQLLAKFFIHLILNKNSATKQLITLVTKAHEINFVIHLYKGT